MLGRERSRVFSKICHENGVFENWVYHPVLLFEWGNEENVWDFVYILYVYDFRTKPPAPGLVAISIEQWLESPLWFMIIGRDYPIYWE